MCREPTGPSLPITSPIRNEQLALGTAGMAKKITTSVGKNGKNKQEDVKIVQELLNDFTKMCDFKKLDVDGLIGPKTISAIEAFQKTAVGMSKPDSRIDPTGESFTTLSKGPKRAESELKKAEQAEKEKQEKEEAKKAKKEEGSASKESKPQVKGETNSIDKKILGLLEAVSAHFGKPIYVEAAQQQSSLDGHSLWQDWTGKFDHGKKIPSLNQDRKLREELDLLYNSKDQDEFCKLVDKNLKGGSSANGNTVNIKKISSDMVDALSNFLKCEKEGDFICLDASGKNLPSKISDDMKKKWK
jgi:hypothetical protein